MGRPKLKEPKKQYTAMLKPSVIKEIDQIADKAEGRKAIEHLKNIKPQTESNEMQKK